MLTPYLFGLGSLPQHLPQQNESVMPITPPLHGAGAAGPWLKPAVAPGTPATGPGHCRDQACRGQGVARRDGVPPGGFCRNDSGTRVPVPLHCH
jgi:hypothetical protein